MIITAEEFWALCKDNGLEWAKETLREYVVSGQPDTFLPGHTSRAMCRVASNGVCGIPDDEGPLYMESEHGVALYMYMWGTSE